MNDFTSKYLGIPYKPAGRGFDGLDCYGLLVLYYKTEFGIDIFDPLVQFRNAKDLEGKKYILDGLKRSTEWIKIDESELRTHDGLLLCNGTPYPNHCGIVTGPNQFLQIYEGPGCNVSRIDRWRSRIHGFYRHVRLA